MMRTLDWGIGRYEDTAAQLEPAARAVVECGALAPNDPNAGDVRARLAELQRQPTIDTTPATPATAATPATPATP